MNGGANAKRLEILEKLKANKRKSESETKSRIGGARKRRIETKELGPFEGHCAHCRVILARDDLTIGRCPGCGARFTPETETLSTYEAISHTKKGLFNE